MAINPLINLVCLGRYSYLFRISVTKSILYTSGSQPFGLQVPVKDKFLVYCPSQQNFKVLCPRIMCFMGPKKIDTDSAFILVKIRFLLIQLNNLSLFHCEIINC